MIVRELFDALIDRPADATVDLRVRVNQLDLIVDVTGLLRVAYYDPTANTVILTGEKS